MAKSWKPGGWARPPVCWPLATPLATFGKADSLGGDGARVGVVVGADAATVGPILTAASQITPFASGGKAVDDRRQVDPAG
ncbi:MAG TPA: hypothetical protein VIK38_14990 [Coriobacteriia bacterium]